MPALPAATDFTGSSVTEGGFKTAMTNQRGFLAGLLGTTGNVDAALAALGALGGQSVAKVAAYTVLVADRGKVFECNGTFTLTLTAAATLGAGFSFIVVNTGSGVITIDPNASELINGVSGVTIAAGAWALISCNGTAFSAMGAGSVPSGVLIGYQVFTASGTYTKATNNPSFVIAEVVGGGGDGGAGTTGGVDNNAGSGGGGGGFSRKKILAAALGSGETVTVGGRNGTSSFGAHCSATGGADGVTNGLGGAGGVGSGGDLNISGNAGSPPNYMSNSLDAAGCGGGSFYGGGGKGGVNGGSYGGGAGGSTPGTTSQFTGASGVVIVWEYA